MDCRPKKVAVVEMWPLKAVRMYLLSVWSSLSYKQTLYLSVFLFLCLYYTRKVSIFFLDFLQTASLSNEMEGLFSTGSQMTTFMLFCLLGIFGALVCLGILWEVYTRCNVMVTKRKGKHYFLLYGSNSFHYGARFPWLLPGHMTSNNKRCFRHVSERGALQNLVRGNCALLPCCSIQLGVYHSFPLSSAFYRFKCQSFVCHALSRVFLVLDSVHATFDVDAIGSATLRVPRSQALARFKFPAT